MAITEHQRMIRRHSIGGSDAGAIRGYDPWRNAAQVFYEKTGQLEDLEENAAMEAGNILEPAVMEWAKKQLGIKFRANQFRRCGANHHMHHNWDGLSLDSTEGLEIKTSGILGPGRHDEWGEAGTDDIAPRVVCQAHHGMAVTPGVKRVHVAVLLGGLGFRMYVIERDNEFAEFLITDTWKWWQTYVATHTCPPSTPDLETLSRMKREPGKVIELPPEMVDCAIDLRCAADDLKLAKATHANAKAQLIHALGDAEGGTIAGTELEVVYRQIERKGYEVKPSTYRKFLLKGKIDGTGQLTADDPTPKQVIDAGSQGQ